MMDYGKMIMDNMIAYVPDDAIHLDEFGVILSDCFSIINELSS